MSNEKLYSPLRAELHTVAVAGKFTIRRVLEHTDQLALGRIGEPTI